MARPKKRFKEKNLFESTVYLTDELDLVAKRMAKRRGMSISTFLRTLIIKQARTDKISLVELDGD